VNIVITNARINGNYIDIKRKCTKDKLKALTYTPSGYYKKRQPLSNKLLDHLKDL